MPDAAWTLQPGDLIKRTELHARYGGRRQGGIGPSNSTPNVLVFSEPSTGAKYGYFDHWDGPIFHYTGEGQVGDQVMTSGNKAIRDHVASGRALRLFKGVRGVVRYEGEYALEDDTPSYTALAPDIAGAQRQVIVFRMRAVDGGIPVTVQRSPRTPRSASSSEPYGGDYQAAAEDGSAKRAEPFTVDPNIVDRGTRGHARTQNALASFLQARGVRPLSPHRGDPDFDLGWRKGGAWFVVEVKSITTTNEARQLRMALGQVLDYHDQLSRRHHDVRALIALERRPDDPRWVGLCERHDVLLVWPENFETVLSAVLTS